MSTNTAVAPRRVRLDAIDLGENIREIDQEHVQALADSIALRGLIVPLVVRTTEGERLKLVAGHHRYLACRKLKLDEVEITIREQDGSSADSAAENVLRKQLSPLGEARAIQHMLDEGYTLDGAAKVLGWSQALVTARAKILGLPEIAQRLLDSGELPVSMVSVLTKIATVSPSVCDAVLAPVASGAISGGRFASNPKWAISYALSKTSKIFAAYMVTLTAHEITEQRLGKKANAAFEQAEELYKKLEPHAYGPPTIRFAEAEVDQARAAGVLIELESDTPPIITDRALYRELSKHAISRTLQELCAAQQAEDADRATRRAKGKEERTPRQKLDAEHRTMTRQFAARAHTTNLDLGSALMQNLAVIDPGEMDVARFFAYGLLGADSPGLIGGGNRTVATIAANGIRLVIEQHRKTTTPRLKNGTLDKTKVAYGEIEDATAWLWTFLDGAKNAGELYGRALVVFASQHYAQQLVLARSKRRSSVLPRSHKDIARKAFERATKNVLPASHIQLQRAIKREERTYSKRQRELDITRHPDTHNEPDFNHANDPRVQAELDD
jgi:ParB/RepB/Spo0J family partition protein